MIIIIAELFGSDDLDLIASLVKPVSHRRVKLGLFAKT